MSKDKVEENAVIEVRNMLKQSNKILSKNIKEGDKDQSTDGFLKLYIDNPDKKTNFINDIDVQVKGRRREKLPSAKNINFQMDIQDIENYKKIGGCIVFYVAFTNTLKESSIYVKPLLPYEINILLTNGKKSKNGKKISIKFKKINKDDFKELERICYQFEEDKNKQYSNRENNFTLADFKNKQGKLEISWLLPQNYTLQTNDIFDEDKFMYFIPNEFEMVKIPIGMGKLHLIGYERDDETIVIGNTEFKVHINMEKIHNEIVYKIGNSIVYNKSNGQFYINLAGSFSMIDKEIEIVKNLIKYKKLILNNESIKVEGNNFSMVFHQIEYIEKLKKICEIFKISDELFIDFSDTESIKNIYLLDVGIIKGKTINFKSSHDAFINVLKVFNTNIAILARKNSANNSYEIVDLFDELMNENSLIFYETKNNNSISIKPKFMAFQQLKFKGFDNSILSSANIINRYNDLLSTLNQFENNTINDNLLNSFELDLIKTYDSLKDMRTLEFARGINDFLIQLQGNTDINTINFYQILYRKRNLTSEEMQKLIIIKSSTNDDIVKACVCILLNYTLEYEMLFENFDDETKAFFETLPIYNLLENIKDKNEYT